MSRHLLISVVASLLLVGACGGPARITASVATPDFVYVRPGVQAVIGFDEPIYYANDYYWRYDQGRWLRSRTYRGGWDPIARPPASIGRLDHPDAYYYRRGGRVMVEYRDRDRDGRIIRRDVRDVRDRGPGRVIRRSR